MCDRRENEPIARTEAQTLPECFPLKALLESLSHIPSLAQFRTHAQSIWDFEHCTFRRLLPIPFTPKLVQTFILKHFLLQHKRSNQIQIQEEQIPLLSKTGFLTKPLFYLVPYKVSFPV